MRLLPASSQFDNLPSRQLFSTRFDERTRLIPLVLRETPAYFKINRIREAA